MIWRSGKRKRDELNEEIRAHLDMDREARMARGESPDDAERNAGRDFGDVVAVREVTSDTWRGEWLHQLLEELRHALRRLVRVPGFTAVAVLTLALGIGANTAIFSVLNGVVLRPLAYARPDQLVFIASQFPALGFSQFWLDPAEFVEFRDRNTDFQSVGAYVVSATNVGADGAPVRAVAGVVSAGLFRTLGIPPAQGRYFTDEETLPNAPPVAILSDEIWHSAFGGRNVVNTNVMIAGAQTLVVGIMPPGFDVHDQKVRVWFPLTIDPAKVTTNRGSHYLYLIGRLKDGVSLAQARTDLELMLAQWIKIDGGDPQIPCCGQGFVHAPDPKNHRLRYDGLQADMVGGISNALWILQAAVALVLLIACANLANLLLMRAESQHRELAVRAALGAGRGRLLTYFCSESAVLVVGGTLVGVALAWLGVRGLVIIGASAIPRAASVGLDASVLVFTVSLALLTGVLFALVPLVHLNPSSVGQTLREAGSRVTGGAAQHRLRRWLVMTEMAFAVMLVIGAGLLIRSFWNLTQVDAGFDRSKLVTFGVALPPTLYRDNLRRVAFYRDLTGELAAIPGVQGAAAMRGLPPRRQVNANDTQFEGYVPKPGGAPANVDYFQYTTPTYFAAMKIPIVEGRAFGPEDGPDSPPVVIINETLARQHYPGRSAVGQRLKPGGDSAWFTIVGVARDVKQGGVDSKTGTELYINVEQTPRYERFAPNQMNLVVRSSLPATTLSGDVHRIMSRIDPTLPVIQFRSMDEVFADAISRPRFITDLLVVFAVVAVLLASIGTYGVLSYAVTERTREIGIRMALGASGNGVLALVLRQGLGVAAVGVVLGLMGASALTQLASTLLFGVEPYDAVTFGGVAVLMVLVAAASAGIPARRAVGIDPLKALRAD